MSNIQDIAKHLIATYKGIAKAQADISQYIDDEISEMSEFDDHELAKSHKAALTALRSIEFLISDMLSKNIDAEELRTEISKLLLVDALKGNESKFFQRMINKKTET